MWVSARWPSPKSASWSAKGCGNQEARPWKAQAPPAASGLFVISLTKPAGVLIAVGVRSQVPAVLLAPRPRLAVWLQVALRLYPSSAQQVHFLMQRCH